MAGCKGSVARACTVSFSFNRLLCGSVQMKPASTSFVCPDEQEHLVMLLCQPKKHAT